MFRRAQQFSLRFVLLVMLASFLSPSFGLGMIASHDQLAHASVGQGHDQHAGHSHDHPAPQHDSQDHREAHTSIGHLLTHMPAGFFEMPRLNIPPLAQPEMSVLGILVFHNVANPPFRPPRAILPL
jgi:hypothetical protein